MHIQTMHEENLVVFIVVHTAQFGCNHPSSFDNMQVFLFYHFGLKMPIHTAKMGFWGNLNPQMGNGNDGIHKMYIPAEKHVI